MQQVRKVTDFTRDCFARKQCQQGISGRLIQPPRILPADSGRWLSRQIEPCCRNSGNSPAFLVLRLEQTGGKPTQFALCPLAFSDVT
jgi:hypothetical protein